MRISEPFPRTRGRTEPNQRTPADQRWLVVPLVLTLIAGGVFAWLPGRLAPATTTTTATVQQGNLTLNVTGSGSVAAARTVNLAFQQSGTITAVNVKVGDQVKAGQVLAQIDAADLQLALQQAQASLKAAEAQLTQAKGGGATPQDLASAQAQLDSAKAQLTQTKTGTATPADIASARAQLSAAQAKLDALKNPSQADLSTAQSKLDQAQTALQSTRNSASQAKTNAQLALQNAVNALTQAQSKFATAQQNWQYVQDTGADPTNPTKTDASGKKVANKLSDTQRQQYYDAYVQAQATLDSAQNAVTQAQVAYDAARQKEVTDVAQAQAAVNDAQSAVDALKNPSASDLTQAQAAVTQAQANLTKLTQGGTATDVTKAQAAVTQAQANLDKLTAPGTDATVAQAEAAVLQAQANVDTAQRNLDEAALKAPFDGVVSAVGTQIGTAVGNGSNAGSSSSTSSSSTSSSSAITIVDRSTLHIDINLSETDAAKVQVGQPVTLTFDALPNVTLNGKVATVAPAATVSQNVVTYPVQVEFDPGTAPVKVGMSATADILTQQINNAIVVPSRAVQTVGNSKAVTVLQGSDREPVTVQVETSATSNGQTEILSCVNTGAQCLQPGDVLAIPTTTTTTTAQGGNRGGFGGFGGGGPVRVPFGGGR
jgi:HlyD family secretion protein